MQRTQALVSYWLPSLVLMLTATLLGSSCTDRRSQGEKPVIVEKPAEQGAAQAQQVGEYEHVAQVEEFKGGVVPDDRKAQRIVNQLHNYMMAVCSKKRACPESAEEAQDAVFELYGLTWPNDPWEKAYLYKRLSTQKFEIRSAGPDGQEGNEDDITVSKINLEN